MSKKNFSLTTLGETVIDFIPIEDNEENSLGKYNVKPGGAPGNVAVGFNKLKESDKSKSTFITHFGKDTFGKKIIEIFNKEGVDTTLANVKGDSTLAIVSQTEYKGRTTNEYNFYNTKIKLKIDDKVKERIAQSEVLHVCSLTAAKEPSRTETIKALEIAKDNGTMVSLDINLRPLFWKKHQVDLDIIKILCNYANIIKVNEEELEFITQSGKIETIEDIKDQAKKLLKNETKIVIVTRDSLGCAFLTKDYFEVVGGFEVVDVDPTGAGDAFVSAFLAKFISDKKMIENKESLIKALTFANAAGAITASKNGAIPAIPAKEELENFINKNLTK